MSVTEAAKAVLRVGKMFAEESYERVAGTKKSFLKELERLQTALEKEAE